METWKKLVTKRLRIFHSECKTLENELTSPAATARSIDIQLRILKTKLDAVSEAHESLLELLYADTDDKTDEINDLEDDKTNCLRIFLTLEADSMDKMTALTSGSGPKVDPHRINLPLMKLPEFGGDVREWMGFWAAFSHIHNDKGIPDAEKFQYLLQCVKPGSEARRAIESFPVIDKNYQRALDTLKSRFGKDTMLVKVYVRDLLQIVVQNAIDSKNVDFSSLVSQLSSKIQNLAELGVTSDKCEDILYPVLESCIPEAILEIWQHSPSYKEKIDDIMKFLNEEVQRSLERSLTRMTFTTDKKGKSNKVGDKAVEAKNQNIPTVTGFMTTNNHDDSCVFCDGKHSFLECGKANNMTLQDKQEIVKKKGLCFICLRKGHNSKKCRAQKFIKCLKCGKRHQVIMCPELHSTTSTEKKDAEKKAPKEDTRSSESSSVTMINDMARKEVLLETLTVKVSAAETGLKRPTRAIFDRCSQSSYIKESVALELGLKPLGTETVSHHKFGGEISKTVTHNIYRIHVTSMDEGTTYTFEVSGIDKISGTIHGTAKGEWVDLCFSKMIILTDVEPISNDIELMLGADVGARMCTGRKIDLASGPTATETVLGWVLSGKLPIPARSTYNKAMCVINMYTMDEVISKMWDLELIGITDNAERETKEDLERATLEHFRNSVTRLDDGRYQVKLPWITPHRPLPSNLWSTEKRFEKLVAELQKNGKLTEYHNIFMTWLKDGIIEKVPPSQIKQDCHYIAHRAVYKESSTTPTRPVFDASASMKNMASLNQCLSAGPNLLELIPSVLARFRVNPVGMTADIAKAFLQISVAEQDRNFLRFLWFDDLKNRDVTAYRHCRVVFGVTSSPFLLGACLQYHLEHATENQDIAQKLINSMYVDNCATSVGCLEDAKKFMNVSQSLLSSAKFDLRDWKFGPVTDEELVQVLGLVWNTKHDTLQLDLTKVRKCLGGPTTRRKLLSFAHLVYDPLGFAVPFTVLPKLLFQRTCDMNLGWDEELPEEITSQFNKWKGELLRLEDMKVPRWLGGNENYEDWTLHVFVDASSNLYSTCVFLRIGGTETTTRLVNAKTRIKPKKAITIPRMELLACLIGSRLSVEVKKYLQKPNIPTICWSDSSTALSWIKSNGNWGVFVYNRVIEIRRNSEPGQWRHVPGEQNPADLPSRGCNVNALLQGKWWEGPSWLRLNEDDWPTSNVQADQNVVDSELRKTLVTSLATVHEDHRINSFLRFSRWDKILRSLAVWTRFINNFMKIRKIRPVNPQLPSFDNITVAELQKAEAAVIRFIQMSSFSGVDDPRLRKFRAFMDDDGIIRVESRVIYGEDDENFKRPVVLPGENEFVKRIIWHEHLQSTHASVGTVLSLLRTRFWILNGRRSVSNVLLACLKCRKFSAKNFKVSEAPLPKDRIKNAKCFEVTGVDLMGPLHIRGGEKVWVVLYTCAVYRAIHLEIVASLSTSDFLQSFTRFAARRGRPSVIYSDNGTNFVGAANIFKKIDWNHVQSTAAVQKIEWRFNPPSAAWWGGFWERLVGVVKNLLRRQLQNSVVTYVQLETLLCEVERVVNERPLTYVSENPNELRVITPAMFLMDIGTGAVPEVEIADAVQVKKDYRRLQLFKERLRSRFRKEYIGQLLYNGKAVKSREAKVGEVVLIQMEDRKRLQWPMGIITNVYPGKDGKIRVVNVRTNNGDFLRPVQRIFPLELQCIDGMEKTTKPDENADTAEMVDDASDDDFSSEDALEDKDEEIPEPVIVTRSGRVSKKPDMLGYVK